MNKLKIYVILCGLVLTFQSCRKSFLEVAPKGALIATKTAEYENMLYNAQALGFDAPSIISGDDATVLNTYFQSAPVRLQRLFRWQAIVYQPEETAEELQFPVRHIYTYNKIINEVLDSEGGTLEAKQSLQAEAKATRAFFLFILLNYYSKPYNASTAATDLAIPLITQADVSQTTFKRATVKEVYEQLISDLKQAIPLMPVNVPHRLRMCKAAAEFTLAKIYWYKGDYAEALTLIKQGKSHLPTSFENFIYNYNQTYSAGNWTVTSGIENRQSLMARTSSCFLMNTSNDLLLAPWVNALYTTNDQRLKGFNSVPYLGTGTFPVAGMKRRSGPFGSQVPLGVYLPEVELIQAECEARGNLLEDSKTTLRVFREKRMPIAEAALPQLDQAALIRYIIEERVREFALYGYRWHDMRRLSGDPLFANTQHRHVIYNAQNGQPLETVTLDPLRLTFRFPQGVIDRNPGMENNP